MRDIPISVLATFPVPNTTDPVTRGPALIVINATMLPLVFLAVSLRYYTRLRIKHAFGYDDFFIGLALVSSAGLTAAVFLGNLLYGWNRHIWDIAFEQITPALKLAFVAKLLFVLAATFTRLSLLCFYDRLVSGSGIKWFGGVVVAAKWFVALIGIVFVGLSVGLCNPVSSYWVYPPHPSWAAHCLPEGPVVLCAGAVNSLADLIVTVIPVPLLLKLKMPTRRRIGVLLLLSLGLVATIAGIVRTYFIWASLFESYDESWMSYPLWIAATVEIDLAIICACLPQLRPLASNWLTKFQSSGHSSQAACFKLPQKSSRRCTCQCEKPTGSGTSTSMSSTPLDAQGSFTSWLDLDHLEMAQ